jgi:hypothetical protein
MRAMTREQQLRLSKLLKIAHGDSLLVEKALRAKANTEQGPELEEVVKYIEKALRDRQKTAEPSSTAING